MFVTLLTHVLKTTTVFRVTQHPDRTNCLRYHKCARFSIIRFSLLCLVLAKIGTDDDTILSGHTYKSEARRNGEPQCRRNNSRQRFITQEVAIPSHSLVTNL